MCQHNGTCENCYFYQNCKSSELLGEVDYIALGNGEELKIHIACDDFYWVNEVL
jgi:hypothetical protein